MRDDATSASTTHPEATRDDATRDFADTERRGVGAAPPLHSPPRGDGRRRDAWLHPLETAWRRTPISLAPRANGGDDLTANDEETSNARQTAGDERRAQQADDADRDNLHQGSSTRQGRQHIGRPLGAERRDD